MRSVRIDMTGQKIGRLTVIGYSHTKRVAHWRCMCDCGKELVVEGAALRSGNTKSCGCMHRENLSARSAGNAFGATHGRSKSREWSSWHNMLNRCNNPNATRYDCWGGRGITVCKRWLKFENFYADMGPRPAGKTLDRKNNGRGYSKANCRWATPQEQSANRRPRS